MVTALIARSLGRARFLLLGLFAMLCALQVVVVFAAAQVQRSGTLSALQGLFPQFFQSMIGGLVFGSFAGLVSLGFLHPVVVLVLVETAIFLASEPAWEVEAGIVDLTMARPVPRGAAVARSAAIAFGATAALLLLMLGAMRLSLHGLAPANASWPPLTTQALLALNLMAVVWWFGGLGLLVAAVVRRRSIAIGATGLLAVTLYLFNLVAEISPSMRPYRPFAPFHYFNYTLLMSGSHQAWPRDTGLLLASAAVLCIAAWRVYARRDL